MNAGVLPVKRLDRAKTRLAEHFDDEQRATIARALLDDAFGLCAATDFLSWWVVSDDDAVLAEARSRGFSVVADSGDGLNDALAAAARAVEAAGAESMTVVPVDVPLARPGDLLDIVDTGATSDMVIVPAAQGGGTNALHLSPPDVVAPRFGDGSFTEHLRLAEGRRLRCAILALPRLALDVDTIADVDALLDHKFGPQTKTGEILRGLR